MKTKNKQHIINVVTLGCSKNLVDSEKLMGQINANNFKVIHNSNDLKARTVVINTCGFIQDAKQESINTILEYVDAKQKGYIDHVFVMGCLSERYKSDLLKEIPEVDAIFGVNNLSDIVKALGGVYKKELIGERTITTPDHFAYLKISEGCDRTCAFCAIPIIRGKHISVAKEDVITEAKSLVSKGAKELILIAQDLTYYGIDIYKKQVLADLLKELSDIQGVEWIRLHYAYPASFPKEVLKVVRERENICNYLDIPFQHISSNVLKLMRRGVNSAQTYSLIDMFRDEVPALTLRTTLLTGHPGEEQKDFEELVEFVEKVKFERLGIFAYSEEEDTYAAKNYADSIPQNIKEERASRIMELQEQISYEKNQEKVGTTQKVLIDRQEEEFWVGRTEGDSPEVDNEVLITTEKKLSIGNFFNIEITGADSFDLFGKI